jgi:hypothetical protein
MKQEGIAVGRTFAAIRNYKVDGNKEMMAIGFMNVVGSTTSCYVTTGSCQFLVDKRMKSMKHDVVTKTYINLFKLQDHFLDQP